MVDAVGVLIRALSFIAMFQAAGGALFLTFYGSRLVVSGAPIRRATRIATVAAAVLVLMYFSVEAARLAGDWSGLWDRQMQQLAWDTAPGTALRLRLIGLLLVLAGLQGVGPVRADRSGHRRISGALCLVGTATLDIAFAMVGHTVDHSPRLGLALLLIAHLTAVTFWFGALWPLRRTVIQETPVTAAEVLEKFSRTAVWIVPGLLVAGGTLVVLLVPGFSVFGQPYGWLLLAKIVGFSVLIGFAALNKLRLTPALRRRDPTAVPRLRRSLTMEYQIIAVVLAVTAVMTGLYSPE